MKSEPLEPALAIRILRQMSRVRIIFVFVLLYGLATVPLDLIQSPAAAFGGTSLAALLAILSYFAFNWQREFSLGRLNLSVALFIVVDILALSFFIYGVGGGGSSYYFILLLCEIIFAAFFFHRLELVFIVGMVCCALTVVTLSSPHTTQDVWHLMVALVMALTVAWLAHGLGAVLEGDRASNQRIIRNLGQPVALLSNEGEVLVMNPQLERLAGTNLQAVVGRRYNALTPDFGAGLLPQLMEGLTLPSRGEVLAESTIEVSSPEPVVLRRGTMPCLSSSGRPNGWVVIWQDITDLVETVRAKEAGLSVVTHEMRSPITCLRLLIEILGGITDGEGEERVRIIEHLIQETDRLSRLVASVLDLARFDHEGFTLEREPMDLRPLLERVTMMFEARGREADVEFVCQCPDQLPLIMGNPDRMEQVVVNLCENAINHTPGGGSVSLEVELGEELVIRVADTGMGVPDKLKDRIFTKFCSGGPGLVGPGRPRMTGGLGLGLALCKRVVELHDGTITVENGPLIGAIFTVRLPRPVPVEAELAVS